MYVPVLSSTGINTHQDLMSFLQKRPTSTVGRRPSAGWCWAPTSMQPQLGIHSAPKRTLGGTRSWSVLPLPWSGPCAAESLHAISPFDARPMHDDGHRANRTERILGRNLTDWMHVVLSYSFTSFRHDRVDKHL